MEGSVEVKDVKRPTVPAGEGRARCFSEKFFRSAARALPTHGKTFFTVSGYANFDPTDLSEATPSGVGLGKMSYLELRKSGIGNRTCRISPQRHRDTETIIRFFGASVLLW